MTYKKKNEANKRNKYVLTPRTVYEFSTTDTAVTNNNNNNKKFAASFDNDVKNEGRYDPFSEDQLRGKRELLKGLRREKQKKKEEYVDNVCDGERRAGRSVIRFTLPIMKRGGRKRKPHTLFFNSASDLLFMDAMTKQEKR